MVDSVTRSSSTSALFRYYSATTIAGVPVWVQEFANSLAGSNTVTFTPYRQSRWKHLIDIGEECTTRLDGVSYTINDKPFEFLAHDHVVDAAGHFLGISFLGGKGSALVFAANPNNTSSSLSNANTRALSNLASKISDAQHALQGGTVIGELKQTISMIRNPASAIRRGVDSYLKGLKKVVKGTKVGSEKRNDVISNSWLEYTYGWRPLINDVRDGVKALSVIQDGRNPRKRVVATGTDYFGDPDPVKGVNNIGSVQVSYVRSQRSQSTVRYSVSVAVKVPGTFGATSQILGVDFPNFLPTLWELIPYSFLVDYFTNIGGIIQSVMNLSAGVNWAVKNSLVESTCQVDVSSAVFTPSGNPAATRFVDRYSPGLGATVSKRTVTRESFPFNGGALIPPLQFKLPGSDSLKWLNIGALLFTHRQAIHDINVK